MFYALQELISHWPHPKHIPARARTWLACSLTSCVILALRASTVSCMALILMRRLLFSVCSIAFSWNMSLMLSTPSSSIILLPLKRKIPLLVNTGLNCARVFFKDTPRSHSSITNSLFYLPSPKAKKKKTFPSTPIFHSALVSRIIDWGRSLLKNSRQADLLKHLQRQIHAATPKSQDCIHGTGAFNGSENAVGAFSLLFCIPWAPSEAAWSHSGVRWFADWLCLDWPSPCSWYF